MSRFCLANYLTFNTLGNKILFYYFQDHKISGSILRLLEALELFLFLRTIALIDLQREHTF